MHMSEDLQLNTRRSETIQETKKSLFLDVINKPIIYKFLKDFTNARMTTNRVLVFGRRPPQHS